MTDRAPSQRLGEKTGISWCAEHERYETLFAGLRRPEDDPHIPDDDSDRPPPDHASYETPTALRPAARRRWIH